MNTIRGVLSDITGVLYDSQGDGGGGQAIPGSAAAIQRLRDSGIPFRFLSNESQCCRRKLVEKLRRLGFVGLREDEVFMPSLSLARNLREQQLRPFLLAHPVKGVLMDVCGVVADSCPINHGIAIGGSAEAINRLRRSGIPFRFVSNGSANSTRLLVKKLKNLGITVHADELFCPAPAVAKVLRAQGLRPFLLVCKDVLEDFQDIDVSSPNCVVVGDAAEFFTFDNMNRAFKILIKEKDAQLFAMGKGKYYKHGGELTLDLGAYVSALEYSCDVKAQIYGKPTREFFSAAIRDMGLDPDSDEILMIGDDIVNDIGGAQACGLKGALVRTGKFRITDENHPDVKPDVIVDDLSAAIDLLLNK